MNTKKIGIKGLGAYLPEKILSNADLEKMVDTSDQWITERTGIKTRHIARDDQATSDLAYEAAQRALAKAAVKPEDLDLIIVATITPDMFFPSTACIVQEKLGAMNAACFDLNAACTGWLYSLSTAWEFLRNGGFRSALVIGAEKLTAVTDWEDRNTCVLFGDGAGAAVLGEKQEPRTFKSSYLAADGRWGKLLYLPAGGSRRPASHETVDARMHYMKMEGTEVFKQAVTSMARAAEIAIERAGIRKDQIDYFIPHQANLRIINAVARKLGLPQDKFYVNLDHCGNLSAASIPVAFTEAVENGKIKEGDTVCFVAFGGGFTWGAMVVTL
jgi:3-oxoacyl-[acyl-carrier-protein] synthase-3